MKWRVCSVISAAFRLSATAWAELLLMFLLRRARRWRMWLPGNRDSAAASMRRSEGNDRRMLGEGHWWMEGQLVESRFWRCSLHTHLHIFGANNGALEGLWGPCWCYGSKQSDFKKFHDLQEIYIKIRYFGDIWCSLTRKGQQPSSDVNNLKFTKFCQIVNVSF